MNSHFFFQLTTICIYICLEGVCIAKKDFFAPKNMVLPKIPNIHVIKLMQSLKTRNYVKETFNWQIYYWTLTDEGVAYLREYLHLGANVVPATHKQPKHQMERPFEGRERRGGRFGGPRDGYRRDGFKKDADDFRPRYVCDTFFFILHILLLFYNIFFLVCIIIHYLNTLSLSFLAWLW